MRTRSVLMSLLGISGLCLGATVNTAVAQNPDTHVDPVTGTVYQRQMRTVQTKVDAVRLEPRVVTITRPQTVVETEPVSRTYFTPVVRYDWQPRWQGLWNPFVPATLTYQYVPQTQWEARVETYNRMKTATRWVNESVVVNERRPTTTLEEQQVEDWVAVGKTAPTAAPMTQVASLPSAGLRPIDSAPTTARPSMSGGLPATVLDPYSTRVYPAGTIFR